MTDECAVASMNITVKMRKNQKGQALLVVVLVMVVILTIGLSVAARTIVNLRTSTEEENSERAFSAAEAGLERALISTSTSSITDSSLGNNAKFTADITPISGTQIPINNGTLISQDSGSDLWMVPHNPDGSPNYFSAPPWSGFFTVYWGRDTTGDCNNAAVEVIVLMGTSASSMSSQHYAFDPCAARRGSNNFQNTGPGGTVGSEPAYLYSARIPAAGNLSNVQMARIIPLYHNDYIGVVASANLPEQGRTVSSTGAVGIPGNPGETKRKITVFKGWPSLPDEYFQYVVFQPNP